MAASTKASRWLITCAAGALVLLQFAFLARLFFTGGGPAGDDNSIHLAEIAQLERALRAGDFNFWNPSANLGFPSGYYYQVAPQLLVALAHLAVPAVSLATLFKLAIAAPLSLLPATCYRALRVCGMEPAPALGAAFAASMVSSSSPWGMGVDSIFSTGVYTQAWGMLFYPLALAYGRAFIAEGRFAARAAIWALATGICHPFVALTLPFALALHPWWRGGALRAAALAGIALAGSAFFWMPILVDYDSFGGYARVASEAGFRPAEFLRLFGTGQFLDDARPRILTLLTGLAVLRWVWRRGGILEWFLLQGLLFAVLVMAGPAMGKTRDDLVPMVRFLAPMQFALAVAAGAAAVEWVLELQGRARLAGAVAGFVAAVIVAIGMGRKMPLRANTIAAFPSLDGAALDEILETLKPMPPGRILGSAETGTSSHWWMYLPAAFADKPALRAYGGAALQSSANYLYLRNDFRPSRHWKLFDLRYVTTVKPWQTIWPEARVVKTVRNHTLLELPAEGIFGPIQVVKAITADRYARRKLVDQWLAGDLWERGQHLGIGLGETGGPPPNGKVLREEEAPSRYSAEVQADGPTTFMARITFHPRWHVSIDGVPARVRRVSPDFPAVDVPPGAHRISFEFRRPWWSWALMAFSLLSVMAWCRAWARGFRDTAGASSPAGPA